MQRTIPLHTHAGVRRAEITTHPIQTDDGLGLTLTRFCRAPSGDVVLVLHGLTTSSDMFIMPEHENLVSHLLDNGFTDVWCMDFRMSNRHPYNLLPHRYTMDDVALFDFPPAIEKIREVAGRGRLHVICHCLGAVSFSMSVFGRAVTGIRSVIANSVSLTPRVPRWSLMKLMTAPELVERVLDMPYISPNGGEGPRFSKGWLLSKLVSSRHPECDVPACHMLSMMWGAGNPALYHHENLADVTHRRGGDLYGPTSAHYYRHVRKMVLAKGAVKYRPSEPRHSALPDDYLADAASITTPFLLVTGRDNGVFADSNVVCHQRLEAVAPGRHQLYVVEGYGHQDVFMGERVARDVFPRMVEFLRGNRQ